MYIVTTENFKKGDRVIKNPKDWIWKDQDGGGAGIITDSEHHECPCPETHIECEWVCVKWLDGTSNSYRIGGKHDLLHENLERVLENIEENLSKIENKLKQDI